MRSKQFWPGDKVMPLENQGNIQSGTEGTVANRWLGTLYSVRMPDGAFNWIDSSELESINPNRHRIATGDTVIVTSNRHKHPYIKIGDLVQVVKVMEDADYYEVIFDDGTHWIAGFELAEFM